MNYAIFRSQPIMTLNDLAQVGSHNKREKKAYNSNPDIKIELSKDNIEIVPLTEKYVKGFYNLTKDYRKEHEERMKTEREDRVKTFNRMLNKSKNVVADELLFTATHEFFDNMTREDIIEWAVTCMDFVYNDLGYKKEQVLHATIHLDEETPHLHCVVVPLVKKFDKRTNTERYTISKKQYIRDKIHLSELQDKYHQRLTEKGYDLERGIKVNNAKHQKIKDLKKTTKYYEKKVETVNKRLDNAIIDFEEKMKTSKNTLIDKDYIKIRKDTFNSMNNVIMETKRALEFQPKIETLINTIDAYTKSHQTLERQNQNLQREVKALTIKNYNLTKENSNLKMYIKTIFQTINCFFCDLLQIINNKTKEIILGKIKEFYSNKKLGIDNIQNIVKNSAIEKTMLTYKNKKNYNKTNNKKDSNTFQL